MSRSAVHDVAHGAGHEATDDHTAEAAEREAAATEVVAGVEARVPIRPRPVTRVLWLLVRGYQLAMSGRPSPCRFWPTCSNYALEALERHGAWRGGWLTLRRLLRCHPWGPHGVDPVPE